MNGPACRAVLTVIVILLGGAALLGVEIFKSMDFESIMVTLGTVLAAAFFIGFILTHNATGRPH